MLTVKNVLGKTVEVDEDFKVTGDPELKKVVEILLKEIDETTMEGGPLEFAYYHLEGKGFDVAADPGDFDEETLPAGAVG